MYDEKIKPTDRVVPQNWKEEQERARAVLDDLLKTESGLSGKEMDFIEDMDKKRNLFWTEKQIDWLDIIYEKVC